MIGEISETQLKRKEEGTALYQTLPDIYNKQLRKIPAGAGKKIVIPPNGLFDYFLLNRGDRCKKRRLETPCRAVRT